MHRTTGECRSAPGDAARAGGAGGGEDPGADAGVVSGDASGPDGRGAGAGNRSADVAAVCRGRRAADRRAWGARRQFGAGDAVEFYGTGVDTPFTDTRVYWLIANGAPGLRVATVDGRIEGRGAPASFASTVERKDRTVFFGALQNGETENWFGPIIGPGDTAEPTDGGADADTRGAGRGAGAARGGAARSDRDRRQRRGSPGRRAGEWDRGRRGGLRWPRAEVARFTVAQALLGRRLESHHPRGAGGVSDVSLVDVIRLTYGHRFRADGDALWFTAQGNQRTTITGFADAAIRVVDLTDPDRPVVVQTRAAVEGPDGFSVTFTTPRGGVQRLLAFSAGAIASPAALVANAPSTWYAAHAADYLLISHGDFLESVAPLVALREGEGHDVAVIDVADLYDEFSFGMKQPQAIRDFVLRARGSWRRRRGSSRWSATRRPIRATTRDSGTPTASRRTSRR